MLYSEYGVVNHDKELLHILIFRIRRTSPLDNLKNFDAQRSPFAIHQDHKVKGPSSTKETLTDSPQESSSGRISPVIRNEN